MRLNQMTGTRMRRHSTVLRVTPRGNQSGVWNRRFMTGIVLLILWGFSALAVWSAGPEARGMMAGEGILYNDSRF